MADLSPDDLFRYRNGGTPYFLAGTGESACAVYPTTPERKENNLSPDLGDDANKDFQPKRD